MNYYRKNFSHIYIERSIKDHPETKHILTSFPHSTVVDIEKYMDVFSPTYQDFYSEKTSQKIILAKSVSTLLFKGAPVCQSFGNEHFYYCSGVMNCIYDCEYCYLQGMYPGANMVIFVNLEDTFKEVEELLKEHPVYLCISYDTDLLALEGFLGFVKKWIDFTKSHPSLTVECRTKSAAFDLVEGLDIPSNFIFAWTLSPDEIALKYEHRAPNLSARLDSIKRAQSKGLKVRLCFDPILHVANYSLLYTAFFERVFSELDLGLISDVSIGTFRISKSYLSSMRKKRPCEITTYPYETSEGYYTYSDAVNTKLLDLAENEISRYIPAEKIFRI